MRTLYVCIYLHVYFRVYMYTSSMSCKCIKVFVGMYYTYVHQYFFPPLPGYLRTLYMYTYVYVYFSLYVQIQIHTIRYKGKSQRGRSRCSMIHMCVFVINEIGVYHIRMLRSIMYVYIYRWKSNMQVKQARQQQQLEEQVWVYIYVYLSVTVPRIIHMCVMARLHVCSSSSSRSTCVCMCLSAFHCDMTHPYVWHDSSTRVTATAAEGAGPCEICTRVCACWSLCLVVCLFNDLFVCVSDCLSTFHHDMSYTYEVVHTEWRRHIGRLSLQVTVRKQTTNCMPLLRKGNCKDQYSWLDFCICIQMCVYTSPFLYTYTWHDSWAHRNRW